MIDDKKIQAAAKETFANVRNSKDNVCMKVGFLSGANWFKEAIWHKREEEPTEEGLMVVVRIIDGKIVATIDNWVKHKNEAIAEALNEGFQQSEIDKFFLTEWAERGRFDKWCYINDILPKGGGK